MSACLLQFKIFEIPPKSPNEILFRNRYIIIGNIINAIITIAKTPQELFIKPRLDETVRNASFIDAPTIGRKLLIAKRAVLIVSVSAPCDIMFLREKTNIKMDIINIVTEVKEFLISLDIPANSMPPIYLIELNTKQIFISGSIHETNNTSVSAIKRTIAPLPIAAVDIFPLSICIVAIIGANDDIAFIKILEYVVTFVAKDAHTLNTYIVMHSVEHDVNAICKAWELDVWESISKIELISRRTRIPLNVFKVLFIPENKYSVI